MVAQETQAAANRVAAEQAAADIAAACWTSRRPVRDTAVAEKDSAAEKKVRRENASNLEEWLRDMCLIDDDELPEVLDAFVDPRYRVTSTPRLFSLDEEDIDTILAPLWLGTRKLIKNAWNEMRLHAEASGG